MEPVLDPKKEQLLKAIVKEYIHTASPVASSNLEQYGLALSSATLRNRMSELESLGFLKQLHSSSGRIPTELGYRHYVDLLMEKEQLTPQEKRMVVKTLESGVREIEDLLEGAAKILAEIGKCTILVLTPQEQTLILKSVQLFKIGKEKVLFLVTTQEGKIFDRMMEMKISKEHLESISRFLNQRLKGYPIPSLDPHLLDGVSDEIILTHVSKILTWIAEMVKQENQSRILVEGTDYLLDQPEFFDLKKLKATLGVLKRKDQISKLLSRVHPNTSLNIFIGYENPIKDFQNLTVIATPYEIKENWFGTLALIGPTRMDYDYLVPLAQFASSVISTRLQNLLT